MDIKNVNFQTASERENNTGNTQTALVGVCMPCYSNVRVREKKKKDMRETSASKR